MHRSELTEAVSKATGLTRTQADAAVEALFGTISEVLASEGEARVVGFGTFGVKSRPARRRRNPRTGGPVDVPPTKVPTFRPGKGLRDTVAG